MTFADRRRIAAAYTRNLALILDTPGMEDLLELSLWGTELRPTLGDYSAEYRRVG